VIAIALLRWVLANRWLLLALALLLILMIQWALRDDGPHDDDNVGEPPPAGGVA
jgi:peptidoglycan/LPS O-acetylase OafA/YrhL